MNIRKATINDLETIQDLNLMLFKKEQKEYDEKLNINWTFSEIGTNYYKAKINDSKSIALVAEEKDKIVGYLVGGLCKTYNYRNITLMSELENMFILDDYRSKGIGSELIQKFITWSKEQGAERAHVEASAQNDQAISCYRKNGFEDYTLDLEIKL